MSVGTKYSYKPTNPDEASTVVIIKGGYPLEIRRGRQTTGFVRLRWSSLEEWASTLPQGAQIMATAPSNPNTKPRECANPDMMRILRVIPKPVGLVRDMTWAEKKQWWENALRKTQDARLLHAISATIRNCHERALTTAPMEPTYSIVNAKSPVAPRIYCKGYDGSLQRIWIHTDDEVFGIRSSVGDTARVARTLVELGFPPSAEIWVQPRNGDRIIRLDDVFVTNQAYPPPVAVVPPYTVPPSIMTLTLPPTTSQFWWW